MRQMLLTVEDCNPVVDFEGIFYSLSSRLHFVQPFVFCTFDDALDIIIVAVFVGITITLQEAILPFRGLILLVTIV